MGGQHLLGGKAGQRDESQPEKGQARCVRLYHTIQNGAQLTSSELLILLFIAGIFHMTFLDCS